jgi:hypothetical protein
MEIENETQQKESTVIDIKDTDLEKELSITNFELTVANSNNVVSLRSAHGLSDEDDEEDQHVQHETSMDNASIDFNYFYKNNEMPDLKNWNFNDMYIRSNSPMASNCNSDIDDNSHERFIGKEDYPLSPSSYKFARKMYRRKKLETPRRNKIVQIHANGSENDSDDCYSDQMLKLLEDNNSPAYSKKKYKKFTYKDIEKSLSQYYHKTENNFNETDLLITYLTGMRSIYVISRNITQIKSYSIVMSTISITIFLAVIAPFVKDIFWGSYLISAGNALTTLLISLSHYLKFDSNSAQYNFMAKQFNKLETRVEYENSCENPSFQKIRDIESIMMEMNEYIQELIPEEAVQLFPLIYKTNIMQFIKKTEIYKKNLIIKFRDIKNEIHYIIYKWNLTGEPIDKIDSKCQSNTPQREREKNRVLYLMDMKEKTKKELMQCKYIYIQLDELFKKEIRYAETNQSCFGCSVVFKPNYDLSKLNPVVRDYLKLVMPD